MSEINRIAEVMESKRPRLIGGDLSSRSGELTTLQLGTGNSRHHRLSVSADSTKAAHDLADFTKREVLLDPGTALLAQANLRPQRILTLLTDGGLRTHGGKHLPYPNKEVKRCL
jgi:hypothetical protein